MNKNMKITTNSLKKMTNIVAGLVMKGLTFEVKEVNGNWVIILTGGY